MPKKFPSNDSVASGETNGIGNGSLSSSTLDLLHSPEKKYSHVCVVTYCTKENVVIGVDLSYIGQDCFLIPSILGKIYGPQTRRLDLSFNAIRSLDNLEMFPNLEELILDNNNLGDLISFIPLPHLHTLSLNKNHFQQEIALAVLIHMVLQEIKEQYRQLQDFEKMFDLEILLKQLKKCYPQLTYLSLLGNPACPDQLSNLEKDEEDYQRYRYYIIHHLPNLKFLDSRPVKAFERSEAQRIGGLMKVAKPKVEPAHEASDELDESQYSPLPPILKKEGTHRGSFGKLRQRYTGTQSEGNRFIRDNEL